MVQAAPGWPGIHAPPISMTRLPDSSGPAEPLGEGTEPLAVIVGVLVAVILLADKSERRDGHDQIDRLKLRRPLWSESERFLRDNPCPNFVL